MSIIVRHCDEKREQQKREKRSSAHYVQSHRDTRERKGSTDVLGLYFFDLKTSRRYRKTLVTAELYSPSLLLLFFFMLPTPLK